jgi:hypothetical protein
VGHSKVIALFTVLLLAMGCASMRWALQKSLRDPGERLESFPEEVWAEYDCDAQKRPFFMIEKNELVPPRVKVGGDFNHRMVYVMCPPRPTGVVSGRLRTRIRFRGDPIVRETTEAYEIKPGRWILDAEVTLPEDAQPGIYAYEMDFKGAALHFEKRLTFVVRAK